MVMNVWFRSWEVGFAIYPDCMFVHLHCIVDSSCSLSISTHYCLLVHTWTTFPFLKTRRKTVRAHAVALAASSFSHGFFRRGFAGSVPCPVKTVLGISLMPGTGCPLVMSSTMCANEVGYGAGGSLELAEAGIMPPEASLLAGTGGISKGASMLLAVGGVGGGRPRALR